MEHHLMHNITSCKVFFISILYKISVGYMKRVKNKFFTKEFDYFKFSCRLNYGGVWRNIRTSAVLDRRPKQLRILVPSPPTEINIVHRIENLVGFDKLQHQYYVKVYHGLIVARIEKLRNQAKRTQYSSFCTLSSILSSVSSNTSVG